MYMKKAFTIPKKITSGEDLVVLPRREYEKMLRRTKDDKEEVTEKDVLRWSKEARELKKKGKLRTFESLIEMEYPSLAKKYNV